MVNTFISARRDMKFKLQFNCPKQWSNMDGDNTTRLCSTCDQKVHNLSVLSEQQATTLLTENDTCVTLTVNRYGQIRTGSGFSKSLLFMGLAIGCTDQMNNSSQISIPDESVDLVEESAGEVKPDCATENTELPPDDPDPKEVERPYVGKVRLPSHQPSGNGASAPRNKEASALEKPIPSTSN